MYYKFIDQLFCWFLGHVPSENEVNLQLEDMPGTVITLCERCDTMITLDPQFGWVKW